MMGFLRWTFNHATVLSIDIEIKFFDMSFSHIDFEVFV